MTNIQAIDQFPKEVKIDFIDIDSFYNFEASVNSQLIAKIWINTSAKYSFWVVEVNDIEVHHCYLFADACDFVKAAYSNGSLHLLPQVTPPVEFTAL
jgi:hypothetical protein